MKEIRKSSQFKKDFKRISKDIRKVRDLMEIVRMLALDRKIPDENNPHHLKGDYKDYMECHIEDDLLLIWFDKSSDVVKLVRLGTHSELYGKGRKR